MHIVEDEEGRVVAGSMLHWRQRGLRRQVILPPATQYSAFLINKPPSESEVHQRNTPLEWLLQVIEQRYHKIHLFASLADPRPAQWRGWCAEPRFTYCLNPVSDTFLMRWSTSTRRTFRKYRAHFTIERDPHWAESIVRMCAASYRRQGRAFVRDPKAMVALIHMLSPQVHCFVALQDRVPKAGLAVLHDGKTAHYWIAGSEPGPSMTVLIGNTLSQLKKDGIENFDFVGANTPSIAEFKRRFGATLASYYLLSRPT